MLTSRFGSPFVAALLLLGLSTGCSGDDGGTSPSTTRATVTSEMIAKERICSAFVQYLTAEARSTRPSDPGAEDGPDFPARVEQRRVEMLDLLASLKEAAEAPDVVAALQSLRTMRKDIAADPAWPDRATLLKIITNRFDPVCDTVNGTDRSKNTTTTAPLTGPTATLPGTTPAPSSSTVK